MYMKSQYPSTQKPGILVERTYKLKNFDMNFKGYHLGCYFIRPTHSKRFRNNTRKLVAS